MPQRLYIVTEELQAAYNDYFTGGAPRGIDDAPVPSVFWFPSSAAFIAADYLHHRRRNTTTASAINASRIGGGTITRVSVTRARCARPCTGPNRAPELLKMQRSTL